MDLEAFFPARDRFALSMTLNNLLAAPSFASWMEGEPLDIDRLLYTRNGKPRHSIFSIAHLSDSERMFFVSLLLNQTLSWMRSQPGTTSLRALLYIDEIFGYLPPVAEPPSKKPLLTLLKQARAFGLGIVLATQNPVDLDYKGLSNTGTWFLGRLQTERDKNRVLGWARRGIDRGRRRVRSRFHRGHALDLGAACLLDAQCPRRSSGNLSDPLGPLLPDGPDDAKSNSPAHGSADTQSRERDAARVAAGSPSIRPATRWGTSGRCCPRSSPRFSCPSRARSARVN